MATYQTPGELGVSFYSGSKTYNVLSAPNWAIELIEDKIIGEETGAYTGDNKDCLNIVGTSENEIVFLAWVMRLALPSTYRPDDLFGKYMFGGIEPLEGCDGDDPHRFLSFVEKYCPNHYDEAVALFEKDLANCKGEFGYSSFDMTDFIERAGTPVGMKCVYYEWER